MARFLPGQSGNPKGRPTKQLQMAKEFNKRAVEAVLNRFLNMTRDQLQVILSDPATPLLDVTVGSIVAQAAKEGDHMRLNFILDRLIGKVKDVTENHNLDYDQVLDLVPTKRLISAVND